MLIENKMVLFLLTGALIGNYLIKAYFEVQGFYLGKKLYELEQATTQLKLDDIDLEVKNSEFSSLDYVEKIARNEGYQNPKKTQVIYLP